MNFALLDLMTSHTYKYSCAFYQNYYILKLSVRSVRVCVCMYVFVPIIIYIIYLTLSGALKLQRMTLSPPSIRSWISDLE